MEHLLIELINHFLLAMKQINIMKGTVQITVPFHHHPPHSGPQNHVDHGKSVSARCHVPATVEGCD